MNLYQPVADKLTALNIDFQLVEHEPALTTEQADQFIEGISGVRTKTMFLTDKKKRRFYLVIMDDSQRLDMDNDTTGLLSYDFDYMIDDMKEQGKIIENTNEIEEKDDRINLVGNIAGKVENLEIENANGEKFKVCNFSIISKDDRGIKFV